MQRSFILAIDIGTSSVRAALYDDVGNAVRETMVKHDRTLETDSEGASEIDADKAFRQVVSAIDEVAKKSEHVTGEIEYAAVSSFWHSLLGVDANGKPTTKVLGWADTRSREQVAELRRKLDEVEVHNRSGARFHPSYWTAKLLWLRERQPEIFARTACWMSFSDYVAMKLFGGDADPSVIRRFGETPRPGGESPLHVYTSVSMASGTGIFDIRKCDWDGPLLEFLKIDRDHLPIILPDAPPAFRLTKHYQQRWKRLRKTKFAAAIGDGAANNIGAGCVTETKAALMVGTSGAMRVAYKGDPPINIPSGLWCYRIDSLRVIVGGALSDGGGLFQWLRDNLKLDADAESAIAARPPDRHRLTFLPFLSGERSTGYHEGAAGGVIGLRASTDAVDIAQAALESVSYRFAEILDQLCSVAPIDFITASGGALRDSSVWTQMLSNVLGRTLTLHDTPEASSRGAVLLALETIGKIEDIECVFTAAGKTFEPDVSTRAQYRAARERHQQFYELILDRTTKD